MAVASFVHLSLSLLYALDQIQDLERVLSARLGRIQLRTSTVRPWLPSLPLGIASRAASLSIPLPSLWIQGPQTEPPIAGVA